MGGFVYKVVFLTCRRAPPLMVKSQRGKKGLKELIPRALLHDVPERTVQSEDQSALVLYHSITEAML